MPTQSTRPATPRTRLERIGANPAGVRYDMGMILPRSGRCAALLAAPALVLLLVAPARAAAHFRPCPGRAAFECATVRVPLDHSGRVKGTIGLHVERRRGTGGRSVAWIGLAGGPGESSTITGYPLWKRLAGPVAARDQVVLFDQRGTGRSGAIDCTRAYQQARTRAGGGTLCGRRLGHKRPFYTTGASVQDIESVRRAVGAGRVELVGVSYGTYVALRYARAHPERTAGLVLDSTVPLTGVDQWNRSTFAAVPIPKTWIPVKLPVTVMVHCGLVPVQPLLQPAKLDPVDQGALLIGCAFRVTVEPAL